MKRNRADLEDIPCAICRGSLDESCIECEAYSKTDAKRVCQGSTHNVVCGHRYHLECIARWLTTRRCCPLCNGSWVYPHGLNLQQTIVAKWIDDEEKIVDVAGATDASPDQCNVLDQGLRLRPPRRVLHATRQRLLARTFAHYLTMEEVETLLESKRREAAPKDA